MKLGIMLYSGPESEDFHTVSKISEAALSQGHGVRLFLMGDGVFQVSRLKRLAEQGAAISLCSHNAHMRGVSRVDYVLFGNQKDWADIVRESDRVMVFG